jgi:carbonic anhydrase
MMMAPTLTLLTTTLLSVSLVEGQLWRDSFRLNFNYNEDSQRGPDNWDLVDVDESEFVQYAILHPTFDIDIDVNECGQRIRPSPIALVQDSACTDNVEIMTRQISANDCTRDDISFEITPHTLRAYFPPDDDACERPTIELGGVDDDPFILVWMELHARSEHVISGRRFDAELQMVHMGTDFSDDKMATVSIMIDATAREDHAAFQYMLEGWQRAATAETERCASAARSLRKRKQIDENVYKAKIKSRKSSNPRPLTEKEQHSRRAQQCTTDDANCGPRRKMYPYSMWPSIHYYRYAGSLTSPPCSAVVNWRVLDKAITISRRQYKEMITLMGTYKDDECGDESAVSDRGENFRPLQRMNLNNQEVAHCTVDDFDSILYEPENQ